MERRTLFNADAKHETRLDDAAGEGAGRIAGYAARYWDGTPATQYELWPGLVERIMPGAFDSAIAEDDVRALFNHDPNYILGRTTSGTLKLWSDVFGLRYSIEPPDTQVGKDVKTSLRRRDVSGSSFSFIVEEEMFIRAADGGADIRELRKVRLFDVGPVTFPAYASTTSAVRSAAANESDGVRQAHFKWLDSQATLRNEADLVAIRMRTIELGL